MRLADPEALNQIMTVDPYFVTQDNGAGAPLHFATTYKQLDMVSGQPAWGAPETGWARALTARCDLPRRCTT